MIFFCTHYVYVSFNFPHIITVFYYILIYFIFTMLQNISLCCISCFRRMNWNRHDKYLACSPQFIPAEPEETLLTKYCSLSHEAQHCCSASQSVPQPWQSWTKAMEPIRVRARTHTENSFTSPRDFPGTSFQDSWFLFQLRCSLPVKILFQCTLGTKDVMPVPGLGHLWQNNYKLESCT